MHCHHHSCRRSKISYSLNHQISSIQISQMTSNYLSIFNHTPVWYIYIKSEQVQIQTYKMQYSSKSSSVNWAHGTIKGSPSPHLHLLWYCQFSLFLCYSFAYFWNICHILFSFVSNILCHCFVQVLVSKTSNFAAKFSIIINNLCIKSL